MEQLAVREVCRIDVALGDSVQLLGDLRHRDITDSPDGPLILERPGLCLELHGDRNAPPAGQRQAVVEPVRRRHGAGLADHDLFQLLLEIEEIGAIDAAQRNVVFDPAAEAHGLRTPIAAQERQLANEMQLGAPRDLPLRAAGEIFVIKNGVFSFVLGKPSPFPDSPGCEKMKAARWLVVFLPLDPGCFLSGRAGMSVRAQGAGVLFRWSPTSLRTHVCAADREL